MIVSASATWFWTTWMSGFSASKSSMICVEVLERLSLELEEVQRRDAGLGDSTAQPPSATTMPASRQDRGEPAGRRVLVRCDIVRLLALLREFQGSSGELDDGRLLGELDGGTDADGGEFAARSGRSGCCAHSSADWPASSPSAPRASTCRR